MFPRLLRLLTPRRSPVAWPARRTATRQLVSFGTVTLAVAAVAYVFRFATNSPFMDEWDLLPPLLEHPVRWSSVADYHNEHRYVLAKTIWTALLLATNFEFRAGMVLTVLLFAAAAFAMVALTRRVRGETRLVDLLIPVLLLSWGNYFNFLMCYQLAFGLIVACGVGLLWTATHAEPGRELRTGLVAGGWLLAAMLNGGFGLATAPPVMAWVAYLGLRAWRTDRWRALLLLVPLGFAALYVGVTVANQPKSYLVKVRPTVPELLESVAGFCAAGLGRWTYQSAYHPLPACLMAGFYAVVVGIAVRVFVRRPAERPRVGGYLAVLAVHFITAGGIAWSRGGAWAAHYVTISAVGLCAAWLILLRYGPPLNRVMSVLLLVGAGGLLVVNTKAGYREGTIQRHYFKNIQADLAAGVPPLFVSGKYGWNFYTTPTSDRVFHEFRARGVRSYAVGVPNPPHAAVPVPIADRMAAWDEVGSPTPIAVPSPGGRVYGLRLVVDSVAFETWAEWELSWATPAGERRRATAYPPNCVTANHVVTFWVDDAATDVRLVTRCPTRGFVLHSAAWLVPTP